MRQSDGRSVPPANRRHAAVGLRRAAGSRLAAALFAAASVATASIAQANEAASAYYQEGRQAFRNSDYAGAVELFAAADRAGYEDLALHYNLGVSYYKLGELPEAEAAFATASTSPHLAPLAYYNLGLVALAARETEEANDWFRQVIYHPQASGKLKALARKALGAAPARLRKPVAVREEKPRLGDFLHFSFDSGYAHDTNIYRAPSSSYVDLSDPAQPQPVTPTEQSGSFVPVAADLGLSWRTENHGRYYLDYSFDGRFYTDSAYSNADAFRNELAVGGKAIIRTDNGYHYWHSRFSFTRFDENYYDRDDGQDQLIGATDVSDRFDRTRIGPSAYYHRKLGWLGYGLRAEGYLNDYANTLDYLSMTHSQYLAGAHVSLYPWQATELRIGYAWSRREYSQRKAKDAGGIRFANNDELEYDYAHYKATLRQKLWQALSMTLSYRYTVRDDNFEGYDDYTRHTGSASLRYSTRRFNARAGVTYRLYDFPNAFTFDLITEGEKDLDTTYAHAEVSYQLFPSLGVRLEGLRDIVNSSDPRSEYERDQVAVSLIWQL